MISIWGSHFRTDQPSLGLSCTSLGNHSVSRCWHPDPPIMSGNINSGLGVASGTRASDELPVVAAKKLPCAGAKEKPHVVPRCLPCVTEGSRSLGSNRKPTEMQGNQAVIVRQKLDCVPPLMTCMGKLCGQPFQWLLNTTVKSENLNIHR